jgi:7-alpha-hydroxysteroid dehydrogenase
MSFSIKGKTAIVTGAANGIGLAIARHFIDQGANVMLADMDEDKLVAERDAIGSDQAQCFAGDLRQKLTIANLQSATIDAFDRVDILVNASRQVLPSNPLEAKEDSFEALFQQNVLANLRLTQSTAKLMINQAKEQEDDTSNTIGTVVNLSSIASDRTHPDLLAYSVSCAALNQMTRSLAVSLAHDRIRVNAIAIGSVMSANLQSVLRKDDDLRDEMTKITPMGRIAEAQEVAEVAQFLAAGSSSFVTGQIVTVDGGRTLIDPLNTAVH